MDIYVGNLPYEVTDAELQAKSTDMPAEALTERALIQIAQAARGAGRR